MEDKKNEEELLYILDTIPYEISLKDSKGRYRYCNKKFLENADYTFDKMIWKGLESFWDEDDCEKIREMDEEVYSKNKGVYFERALRSKDNVRWYTIYKAPLIINDQKYLISLYEESTINKCIGNLMSYELEKDSHDILGYHDVLNDDHVKDKIVLDDEFKNRIMLLCENLLQELSAVKICIYIHDEESNDLNLYLSTDSDYASIKKKISLGTKNFMKFMKQNVEINYQMLYDTYDGEDDLKIYEIRYGNNILGIMTIYYNSGNDINFDMDELIKSTCYKFGLLFQNRIIRKKLKEEEEKKIQYKQALHMEKLKTEFFAGISHEFRTPLNIIITAIQLTESVLNECDCEKYKSKIQRNLKYIKQNSNRLIRLVNNIIDVNKIDSGYNELNYTNCNIVSLVEDIAMSVSQYIQFSGKNLIFDTEEEEIITACDEDKVERIMMNLLSNAIKFSYQNTDILVKLKLNDARDKVIISVFDEGRLISKMDEHKLFDKYVQLDRLIDRPCEGSGIGLYIVKSFVKQHGGEIWVNYEVQNGTEIDFTIPIKTVSENEAACDLLKSESRVEKCNIEFSDIYSI